MVGLQSQPVLDLVADRIKEHAAFQEYFSPASHASAFDEHTLLEHLMLID